MNSKLTSKWRLLLLMCGAMFDATAAMQVSGTITDVNGGNIFGWIHGEKR
jgi:hypothetical protein